MLNGRPNKKGSHMFYFIIGTTGQTNMRDVGGKGGKSVAEEHDTSKNMTEEN